MHLRPDVVGFPMHTARRSWYPQMLFQSATMESFQPHSRREYERPVCIRRGLTKLRLTTHSATSEPGWTEQEAEQPVLFTIRGIRSRENDTTRMCQTVRTLEAILTDETTQKEANFIDYVD